MGYALFMSIRLVLKFLKAKNEREATLKMFAYQVKNQRQCNVISIYESKSGGVTVWFYDEIKNEEFLIDAATKPIPRR